MGVMRKLKNRLLKKHTQDEKAFLEQIKSKFSIAGGLISVSAFLKRSANLYSKDIALIEKERQLTYKQLYFYVIQLANVLSCNNIRAKTRVIIYFENSLEFYISYFAVWTRGAIAVPVNIFLHDMELAHIIKDAEPSAILVQDKFRKKIENLQEKGLISGLPPIFSNDSIDMDARVPRDIASIENLFSDDNFSIDELALLLYTSGTTGKPKGVMLSSKNILTNAMQAYARTRLFSRGGKERFFAVLPLFHVFAQCTCMWLPLLTGSSVIVVSKIDRGLILDGLKKRPTLFFGFPALYGLLCMMRNAPLHTVRRFVSGADAMPDKIRSAFAMIYGRKICGGYGLTEASPVVSIDHTKQEVPTYVVGKPLTGIECQIRDDHGNLLKSGVGTLWVRGDNIMMGYYKASEATEKVLQNGWLNTGDLASFDIYGNLAITGRSKDLIIHKGLNIYPQEVENILMSHPQVFKAAVVGREESVAGQVPIAFVAVKDKDRLSDIESRLRTLCASSLASYKIPRKFICVDDLPMSPTGKVDKKQLHLL